MFDNIRVPALRYLKDHRRLRFMVRFLLFSSRYHRSAERAFREYVDKIESKGEGETEGRATRHNPTISSSLGELKTENEIRSTQIMHGNAVFPRHLPRIGGWFWALAAGVCVVNLMRQFLPWEPVLSHFDLHKSKYCYLPGKFVQLDPTRGQLSEIFLWNMSIWHLNWGLWQYFRHRPLPNFLIFLYQNPKDIARVARACGSGNRKQDFESLVSPQDVLLRSIVAYPRRVKKQGQEIIVYQCRPNRDTLAYDKIGDRVAQTALGLIAAIFILYCVIVVWVTFVILSDGSYLSAYPGCDPELELLYQQNKVSFFTVSFPSWQKVYAVLMDVFVNVAVYTDLLLGCAAVAPSAEIFNFDLRIYWQHSMDKLEKLLSMARSRQPLADSLAEAEADQLVKIQTKSSIKMDDQINQLQDEIVDFFDQLDNSNAYVSDILSSGIFIWLVGNTGARFSLTRSSEDGALSFNGFKFYFVFGMCLYTLIGSSLWDIKRQFERSYRQLYSLAAHSHPKHKRQFIKVAEKFLNHSGFTVLGGHPFTLGFYLSIVNWTLTALSIVDNFL